MLRFLIDVFCKDTAIGLCELDGTLCSKIYKNSHYNLFRKKSYKSFLNFTDPIACRLY